MGGTSSKKTFKFPDFREALKFVNHVGELAEPSRDTKVAHAGAAF
jgi:pterin-4a-carbinolamine dehydratase